MRAPRLVLLLAASLLAPATAIHAQQSASPAPRDAQAVLMLQRSLAALTGTATVKDVTLTGSATRIAGSDNESGTATLQSTAVGQGRIDLSLSGGQRSEVIDISQSSPVGNWSGPDGAWHPMAGHNLFSDPSWFFPTFLIHRALSAPNYVVSPMDAETMDGVAVEHLKIYQQAGMPTQQAALIQRLSQIDLYLNASTLLPVSISFNAHPDNDALTNIPIQIKFSNYQIVQGISVPYRIQKYIQNGLALDVTVTSAQVNSGLSAADFQVQ
ncbi:MAG: hypothetical protein ACYDDI_16940 [Candidatus Acidiferrales bacterium]